MKPTPIWIYDRNEILRVALEPKNPAVFEESAEQTTLHASMTLGVDESDPKTPDKTKAIPYRNGWYPEQLNGEVTLTFEVPNDVPGVEYIEGDGRAVIRDRDGNLVEFIIRKPVDSGGWKRVFAEGSDYENIDEWVTGYTQASVTLQSAASAVLQNTRWEVGECGDFGTNSVDLVDVTVKNAIHQLTELFGAERRYRVESEGNQIVRRYIDFLPKRGQESGKRFEEGKDIISYQRMVDTTGIKTALYGRGASQINDGPRLTFADVEWSVANGDPIDKPLGQTWIGDPNALQQWGYDQGTRHRWGIYDGQEEDPGELLLNTWNHLQTLTDSIDTYDFDVMLLENITGYGHEKVRLGDTISGLVRSVRPSIEVEASVIEYRQNLNDPRLSQVTLGAFRKYFDANVRIRDVEKTVNRNQGNWNKKPTHEEVDTSVQTFTETYAERKITRDFVPPDSPEQYDLWIDLSPTNQGNPPVWKQYNGTSWEKLTRENMDEIGGQVTETQVADDAISTPKLKVNAVTANELAANTVNTNHISTAGLDAGVITAGTFIGIRFLTSNSGSNIEIVNDRIISRDTSGRNAVMESGYFYVDGGPTQAYMHGSGVEFRDANALPPNVGVPESGGMRWTGSEIEIYSSTAVDVNAILLRVNGNEVIDTAGAGLNKSGSTLEFDESILHGSYPRILSGSPDLWFKWSTAGNQIAAYKDGAFIGYIDVI